MSKRLLALDQATHTTGWAIFDNKKLVNHGTFTVKEKDLGQRLMNIKRTILDLINENNIDEVIFEDIQLQNNVHNNVATFKYLAELIGVLVETFSEENIPYSAVLPTVWKSKVGIKGRKRAEQKANAQKYIIDNYGISATQDESDAICIGIYHCLNQQDFFDWR